MKSVFSKSWNKSKQARKQRKYVYNAPLHIQGKFLSSILSKPLRQKYDKRNIRVKKGDKVKILRGSFKGEEHKIERIDVKNQKIYLERIEITKKDGSKATRPFNASNLMITDLNIDDKRRLKRIKVESKKASVIKEKENNSKGEQ